MSVSHIPSSDPYRLELNKHVIFQENKCMELSQAQVREWCLTLLSNISNTVKDRKLKVKKAVIGSINAHFEDSYSSLKDVQIVTTHQQLKKEVHINVCCIFIWKSSISKSQHIIIWTFAFTEQHSELNTVGTVYHLVIYMQSNKIHKVF